MTQVRKDAPPKQDEQEEVEDQPAFGGQDREETLADIDALLDELDDVLDTHEGEAAELGKEIRASVINSISLHRHDNEMVTHEDVWQDLVMFEGVIDICGC